MQGSREPKDLPTIYITGDSDTQNIKIRKMPILGGEPPQYLTNIHKNKIYCYINSFNIKTVVQSDEKISKKG